MLPKLIALVATLVFGVTLLGLLYGLYLAFKNKDDKKKKSISISSLVFCILTFISYTVMGYLP
jgi:hypothetical protein